MKTNDRKNNLCFCLPLPKTAWAQNLILDQSADTSLKHETKLYLQAKKNTKGKIVLINQPLLKL